MMPGLPEDHPSIRYYDGDYPGTETSPIASNLDATLPEQGLAHDIDRFREIALEGAGAVLEIGCGTGRVLVPLARAGLRVTGIDISAAMIAKLEKRLAAEPEDTRRRARARVADARTYKEPGTPYTTIIVPFNGLSCIPDARDQLATIARAASLLEPGGKLVVDLVNPFVLPLQGSGAPQPFFTRVNPESGRPYTRFAAMGPVEADQTQKLYGWYDEIDADGHVKRLAYDMRWRVVFAFELELMLEAAGLKAEAIEGDHQGSSYRRDSPKIFAIASKPR